MPRPSRDVLIVFALVVLIGGSNFVAVRFSNRELPPFWGAGLRFGLAGALLLGFALWRRIPLPLGSALPGCPRPRLAIPIHWGTFYPFELERFWPKPLADPPVEFARIAPDTTVRILAPGAGMDLPTF